MVASSLEAQPGSGALEAWAPLGLLDFAPATPLPDVEKQGLTPVRLAWEQGRLPLLLDCLLYTSPSPRDRTRSRMPSSA